MCEQCRPISDVIDLDQRGVSLAVEPGDLVTDVVVVMKVVPAEDGPPYVVVGASEGTDWITQQAITRIAAGDGNASGSFLPCHEDED